MPKMAYEHVTIETEFCWNAFIRMSIYYACTKYVHITNI